MPYSPPCPGEHNSHYAYEVSSGGRSRGKRHSRQRDDVREVPGVLVPPGLPVDFVVAEDRCLDGWAEEFEKRGQVGDCSIVRGEGGGVLGLELAFVAFVPSRTEAMWPERAREMLMELGEDFLVVHEVMEGQGRGTVVGVQEGLDNCGW